ncbi:hypothetical protein DPMN_095868 [Dreissena polymorpha]|uniref:Major facilitator superfamily (MFS) profile domain-containing protein n=1 Tax=Dreissena polymorpha TaxID=45954 RepID=A0A9D4LAB1_DREPO|nr:hypothetical protein DPMN_095868 [Dreissena polymorpha]
MIIRWSHRQVAMLGAVLANLGLIVMPFAPNLVFMYAFFGILTGLGNSLVYVPSHVLSGLYYSKHRSLATGIATAGSGFGTTVFPIVINELIQYYGWRGSLFIISGLNLHLLIFTALLWPVPRRTQVLVSRADNLEEAESVTINVNQNVEIEMRSDTISGTVYCDNEDHKDGVSLPSKVLNQQSYKNGECKDEGLCVENVNIDKNNVSSPLMRSTSKPQALSVKQKIQQYFSAVFTTDFIIYFLSNIFWNAGAGIMLIFFAEYVFSIGLDKQDSSILYALIGAGNCVGCVLGGLLGNIKHFDRIHVYLLGNIGAGLLPCLIPWKATHTFWCLAIIVVLFGLMFGIILGLLVVVTSDLLGTEALGRGFGYLMLSNGIGTFSGPPIAGLLIDSFKNNDLAMFLSGGFSILGGAVMCLVPLRRRFCHTSHPTVVRCQDGEEIIEPPDR